MQRVKEQLHKRIIELEANLDQKQALQLQIERLRGSMEVMRLMNEEGDLESKKKLQTIQEEIKESEEELDSLETLNQTLIIKERLTNDEVQEARKELINVSIYTFLIHPHKYLFIMKQCDFTVRKLEVNIYALETFWLLYSCPPK